MRLRSIALAAMVAAAAAWPGPVPTDAAAPDRQTTMPVFREAIPNVPGKSLVGVVVHYPPGGAAHFHPQSSFVIGYVLSGSVRSQVNQGREQVFRAGGHWTEPPGAYRPVSGGVEEISLVIPPEHPAARIFGPWTNP